MTSLHPTLERVLEVVTVGLFFGGLFSLAFLLGGRSAYAPSVLEILGYQGPHAIPFAITMGALSIALGLAKILKTDES